MQKQSIVTDDIALVCSLICAQIYCDEMCKFQGQVYMIKLGWSFSFNKAFMDVGY